MKATIFDVQRFSVHDGPGIRTTVFMKGCPLRCKWCHNPEGFLKNPQLQFQEEKCIGCGGCGNRNKLSDAEHCPTRALSVCGREIEENELLEEVLKDRAFYGEDGGVTFSGGECLLQTDFVVSVLSKIKQMGLSTAVDTCGFVQTDALRKTLPVCDLYLYDVKCMDPCLHKEYTGVDNAMILDNLRFLSETGKDIWIRVPVIPDFNNTREEMTAIAEFIASLPAVKQVTLLPYHTLGTSKYKTLGLEYPFFAATSLAESKMQTFRQIFRDFGISL